MRSNTAKQTKQTDAQAQLTSLGLKPVHAHDTTDVFGPEPMYFLTAPTPRVTEWRINDIRVYLLDGGKQVAAYAVPIYTGWMLFDPSDHSSIAEVMAGLPITRGYLYNAFLKEPDGFKQGLQASSTLVERLPGPNGQRKNVTYIIMYRPTLPGGLT